MDTKFISERIAKLCVENGLSDREVSLSLGKNQSYINFITNGKSFPTMESFLDICDFFKISPSEFFDVEIKQPNKAREIYIELQRLYHYDMQKIVDVLKIMKPSHFQSFMDFVEQYGQYCVNKNKNKI